LELISSTESDPLKKAVSFPFNFNHPPTSIENLRLLQEDMAMYSSRQNGDIIRYACLNLVSNEVLQKLDGGTCSVEGESMV
jgi:hypothetical protein